MSLSQIMEEQNKQSELELLSTSIQDLKNSLTESIQNVLNVQLKKLWDHQENQLKEITREFKMDIEVYQERAEFQTKLTIERIQQDTLDKFNKIYKTNTNNLTKASANLKKLSMKNVLMNFVCALILVMASIGGVLFVANYRDGSEIAAAKAEEALVVEREKIAETAILKYKNSEQFIEDSCKEVAENIIYLKYINYLNKYIRSKDINKYPTLKKFYKEFIKCGAEIYEKNN